MKFSEVIGQNEAKQRLMQLVQEQRIPHALMFCGPEGCGKKALALAFASYLLGEREAGETAGSRFPENAEAMLRHLEHPDLYFSFPVIRPAGTSSEHKMESDDFGREWRELMRKSPYFTMEQWMVCMNAANQQAEIGVGESHALLKKLSLKASQGGFKVSIIWLPERMNQECANKLLKLLEEPPAQTIFIMVCEEPEKLLETIRSRVQRINIKRLNNEEIKHALVSQRALDEETAQRIARIADGSWTKALGELDASNENLVFFEMFKQMMRLAWGRKIQEMKEWSETAATYGREKQKRMLTYFQKMVRENFMYNFRQAELIYMSQDEEQFASKFARFINEGNVMEIDRQFAEAQREIGQNANPRIVFFDLSLQMIVLLIQK
ncbi:MAG: AAA family ATPase [Prevotella sp.]|nr:AAA family ATPase [Prevotella sp.]